MMMMMMMFLSLRNWGYFEPNINMGERLVVYVRNSFTVVKLVEQLPP